MVALLTSVRNSPCFGGLRRTKTCHRQLFARPSMLFGYFLHDAKSDNPFSLAGSFEVLQTSKSAHRNGSFALQQLKPFYGSFEVLQTSNQRTKQQPRTNQIKFFCRPWRNFFPPFGDAMLLPQQFLPLRGFLGSYAALFCCLRQPLSPPVTAVFGGKAARGISPVWRNPSLAHKANFSDCGSAPECGRRA